MDKLFPFFLSEMNAQAQAQDQDRNPLKRKRPLESPYSSQPVFRPIHRPYKFGPDSDCFHGYMGKAEHNRLQKEGDRARAQVEELKANNNLLHEESRQARAQIRVLEADNDHLRDENSVLENELTSAQTARDTTLAELTEMTTRRDHVSWRLNLAQRGIEHMLRQVDAARQQKEGGRNEVQPLLDEVQILHDALVEETEERESTSLELAEVTMERDDAIDELREQIKHAASQAAKIQAYERTQRVHQQQITNLQDQIEIAERYRYQAEQELDHRQDMLDAATQREQRLIELINRLSDHASHAGGVMQEIRAAVGGEKLAARTQNNVVVKGENEEDRALQV